MRPRVLVLLLLATTTAGGAALIARGALEGQPASEAAEAAPPPARLTEVLVAAADLPAGSFVKSDQLRWQAWPSDDLPETYLVKGERERDTVVGAVVRQGIALGEPITDRQVVKPGERGFLAAVLNPGMRAASVAVDATTGNAGLILPGDRVDMILTQDLETGATGPGGRMVGETVLKNLRVLAVDQKTNDQNGEPVLARTVTLEVTPKQAEEVAVATRLGKLSLSLRSLARAEGPDGEEGKAEADFLPASMNSHTWDRDVSAVLQNPASRPSFAVSIVRGGRTKAAATETIEGEAP
jgi:pilus assembly protein CpaB